MNSKTLQLVNSSPLSRGAILLVLYLQSMASGELVDKRQIGQVLGISDRHVLRLLQELEEQKIVGCELEGRKKIYKLA